MANSPKVQIPVTIDAPPNDFVEKRKDAYVKNEQKYHAFAYEYVHNGYDKNKAFMDCGLFCGQTERSVETLSSRLLNDVRVQRRIEELEDERKISTRISFDWVISKLVNNLEACERGETTPTGRRDVVNAFRYIDAIAKMHGYYAPLAVPENKTNSTLEETVKVVSDLVLQYKRDH